MSVCMETTSVPRWDEERTVADGGRTVTVLSFGDAATDHARRLVTSFEGRRVSWLRAPATWGDAAAEVLQRQLSAACVGWRLVLVGDEAAVLAARAVAVAAGALDDEILPEVLTTDTRTVYCAHCRHTHDATAAIGQASTCPACSAELVVYHHVSRHHGAYLGYQLDAEES
ncbi:50S ribosomal protein L32 [Rhodococcus aetherivorans]|uniref:50S ribosomal protein L32 n=1 Tax=Rhodococcus aetherivorans TaxID=191292 RepID=A0AA46SBT2_9NOCA|nr:50S ribosomal protein L32 [Rhodococcus aetherivorans]UYF92372.1 50S ribosomal protein L32 [Rhodococcus aetherivorans]